MAAPRKPRPKRTNEPQPYFNTLAPTLPLAPDLSLVPQLSRTTLLVVGGVIGTILIGIAAGLALRPLLAPVFSVTPGPVAEVTNPQYTRILQAKVVAGIAPETIQRSAFATSLQPGEESNLLQLGGYINSLQPVLSAYDSQGSVGGPAR